MKCMFCMLLCLLLAPTLTGAALAEGTPDIYAIRENLTSLEIADDMGNGINLGNTMEAYGHTSLGVHASPSRYEALWGMPSTTRKMIEGMKACGFDTIRIPVAWTNTMDFEHDNFAISEAWMDRVEEIVRWALEADMYVILNDHWDGGWLGMFGSASPEKQERAMNLYVSLWTQVGERFAKYGDHLIFEAANEEFGNRFNDTDWAEDSGTLDTNACYAKITELTQIFVDLIRSQGGNNAQRFLLIPGFNTNIANTVDDRYQMPTDAANRLLLSVHYYDPDGFCQWASVDSWGSEKDFASMADSLSKLTKWTDQGYGIVIGEYGVLGQKHGGTELRNDTLKYLTCFLDHCDLYGYAPMLWDCNDLYLRLKAIMYNDDVLALYTGRSRNAQADMTVEEIKAAAQASIDEAIANATAPAGAAENQAIAWLMFNSADWSATYSVGDVYDPSAKSAGIVATDVEVTGPGRYTVGLDFSGYGSGYVVGTVFSALAMSNGEQLFPGCFLDLKEIQINGERYQFKGRGYTTSDDGKCTRVNLYNSWVTKLPGSARIKGNNLTGCMSTLLNNDDAPMKKIRSIYVTFELVLP